LLDQNRGQWDPLLIRRGLTALERAEALGGALGPYALQAAIAACHARARTPEETDWPQIAALYDALAQIAHSPVVELNRAVAYGMAFGPVAGLELADALVAEPSLRSYHLLPSVRGDLLAKLGRSDEARSEFERAAALTRNARERELLVERAIRDHGVIGADLAWFGHLQQLTYRRLAARPEWRDPVLAALPSDIRGAATANADATADLRATVVPGPNLPTTWRIVEPAPL